MKKENNNNNNQPTHPMQTQKKKNEEEEGNKGTLIRSDIEHLHSSKGTQTRLSTGNK